jgi:uncharacterized protein (TIGR02145 family)
MRYRERIRSPSQTVVRPAFFETAMLTRIRAVMIAATMALPIVSTSCSTHRAMQDRIVPDSSYSSTRMADGKQWMAGNLRLNMANSYCYGDVEPNCHQYGRLYTWESAHRACQPLGDGWRLPTDEDWRQMANHYGGIFDDSPDDRGRQAYEALLIGGNSGFDALLSGGRLPDGRYEDLEAHGFYWTASEDDLDTAWYYNFGRGSLGLYRQGEGEKRMALAVRCVR